MATKKNELSDANSKYIESKVSEIKDNYVNKYFFLEDSKNGKYPPFKLLTSIRYDPNLRRVDDDDGSSVFFLFEEHIQRLNFQLSYFKWNYRLPRGFFLQKLKDAVQSIESDDLEEQTSSPMELSSSQGTQSAYKLRVTIDETGNCNIESVKARDRPNLLDGLNISIISESNDIIGTNSSFVNSFNNYSYINDYFNQINEHSFAELIENSLVYNDSLMSKALVYSIHVDTQPTPISCFTSFKTTFRDHYNQARQRTLKTPNDYSIKQDVLLFNHLDQIMECSISNVAFKRNKNTLSTGKVEEVWITPSIVSGCLCGTARQMLLSKGLIREGIIFLKDVRKGEEILFFNAIVGVARGVIV